jgi:hypothetical protein
MLIQPNDLGLPESTNTAIVMSEIDGMQISVFPDLIAEFINQVGQSETLCWISNGTMSMHHIIEGLVSTCAPASVYFTTWAISEDAARALFFLKQSNRVTEIKAIIDHRVLSGHGDVYNFILAFFDHLQLEPCHAKMVLISSGEISYAVYSSANLTTNNRIENTIVCRAADNCAALRQWFETKFYETHRRSAEHDRGVGKADDDAPSDSPGTGG